MKLLPFRAGARAFSLVEIALALGIVAFVLLSLVGLMSVGLDSGKEAQIETLKATVARTVMASLQTNQFQTFSSQKYRFDFEGSTNVSADSVYLECEAAVVSPDGIRPEATNDMRGVTLKLIYPVKAPPARQITNTLHASLSRQN